MADLPRRGVALADVLFMHPITGINASPFRFVAYANAPAAAALHVGDWSAGSRSFRRPDATRRKLARLDIPAMLRVVE